MSDSSSPHEAQDVALPLAPPPNTSGPAAKRKTDAAGLPTNGVRAHKSVKRRASKACQSCRSRKVRCNVVEQIPCTNCRLDEVECVVSESKRKKKWSKSGDDECSNGAQADSPGSATDDRRFSLASVNIQMPSKPHEHMPHSLYQDIDHHQMLADSHRRHTFSNPMAAPHARIDMLQQRASNPRSVSPPMPSRQLPPYLKPLPARIGGDEVIYLSKKGALTIPPTPLRNALLQSYLEYIHPYMPIIDMQELCESIDRTDGANQISLLVFQAIMFSGIASVDIKRLRAAGYTNRREARREFFQKTRLLYEFDYEADRISLIQSLLLMTYWYETPDDQKDSHHWMGIAVSLCHTIGLHRNPERSSMTLKRRKLWKRIWWSTYMRDRLIALGMRRPTRIKDEDFDVPMLELDDFEIGSAGTLNCLPSSCTLLRDVDKQRHLATLCVEKSKLCICISHVLAAQYSVLHNNHGVQSKEGSTRTTMMLVARKADPEVCGVRECDDELRKWKSMLPPEADYQKPAENTLQNGEGCIEVNRSLLHLVYHATVSALHRPQVLPSGTYPVDGAAGDLLELSRSNVRFAASQITAIAENLDKYDLVRFLPTVGITVLLPAIIIHLLDIKAPDETTRRTSLQGFCQCMQIMSKLRDIYAAADYSTAFLEAAIRKAEIVLPQKAAEAKDSVVIPATESIAESVAKQTIDPALTGQPQTHLTPPPDHYNHHAQPQVTDADIATQLHSFLADTPPESHGHREDDHHHSMDTTDMFGMADFEPDFDALVNLDVAGEAFGMDDAGNFQAMHLGDHPGGFLSSDIDWMKGMHEEDGFAVAS